MRLLFITLSLVIASCSYIHAASDPILSNEKDSAHSKPDQKKWSIFPVISSNPETGAKVGAKVFYFLPSSDYYGRSSSIDFQVFTTSNEQSSIVIEPNLYFSRDRYHLKARIYNDYWNSNYFGIGNNTPDNPEGFDSRSIGVDIDIDRLFPRGYTFGAVINIRSEEVEPEAEGMLETDDIPGSGKGTYIGTGFAVGYDTRDNTNAPHSGNFIRYEHVFYSSGIGSDLDFRIQTIDVRHYFETSAVTTLAVAGHLRTSGGDTPFRYLSSPDGVNILRGIEKLRYLDNDLLSLQSEFRFPIQERISASVFAEVAQVATDIKSMELDEFKPSIGGGIRYALNSEERLNLRGDVAWVDNDIGVIFTVREAF